MRKLTPPPADVALGVGVAVIAALEVGLSAGVAPKLAAGATELVFACALAWRRSFPLAVTVIGACAFAVEAIMGVPIEEPVAPLISIVVAVYSLALYAPARAFVLGLAAFVAADTVAVRNQHKGVGNFVFGLTFAVGTAVVGRAMRGRVRETQQLELRAEVLQRERAEVISEERARIARELHDVIAHSVSVMTVQAGAAEEMLKLDPARAFEPIRAVQETGRQALVEMKRLVGMLREGDEEMGLVPQPGVADLDRLVAQVRGAGLPVELRVEGAATPLPLGVDLSVYRVVQEALTNALKHSAARAAVVLLRYDERTVTVDVTDDGRGEGGGSSGHGLDGMRERIAVFGGSFAAGPRDGGGFAVQVTLPLDASA
jgi:signal transduction histidine kinase